MAPEILNKKSYGHKCDVWSFGVSLYESLYSVPPFFGTDKEDLTRNVNLGIIKITPKVDLSNTCLDFLGKCLKIDPSKRISF